VTLNYVFMFCVMNYWVCVSIRLLVTLQHLFDRLFDHWKTGNKVQTLMILGHLVRREPLWLSRIVSHPLLLLIAKGLKVAKLRFTPSLGKLLMHNAMISGMYQLYIYKYCFKVLYSTVYVFSLYLSGCVCLQLEEQ